MAALDNMKVSAHGTVTDPKDFSEGGGDHRKSVLASSALIVVLLTSTDLKPTVFGVSVSVPVLWMCLGLAHIYFFTMWRLTTSIEADQEKRFWNISGLWKQATVGGTSGFPGKMKAQLFFVRALPIWAFVIGFFGVSYGLLAYYTAV